MSWLKKGEDLNSKEFLSTGSSRYKPEFWLKSGKEFSRKVIFLDDPGVGFNQHTLKIKDAFEKLTCLDDSCPMCAANYYKTACFVFTVLDTTPYKDKNGVEKPYYKKVLVIRGKAMKQIIDSRREANGGSLKGLKMQIMRTNDKAPNSGDDYQVLGKVDLEKLPYDKKEDRDAYDYEEMYAPLSASQVEAKLKYAAPPNQKNKKSTTTPRSEIGGFGEETGTDAGPSFDADIPF